LIKYKREKGDDLMSMNFLEAMKEMEKGSVVRGSNRCFYKLQNNILYFKSEEGLNDWIESKSYINSLMSLTFERVNLKLVELEKLGREVGEFKVGDIVRHIPTGDIDEVIKVDEENRQLNVSYYCTHDDQVNVTYYPMEKAELVCPVEYRVDKE
jgi:hypothetical protein